jgi:hypothetical protein
MMPRTSLIESSEAHIERRKGFSISNQRLIELRKPFLMSSHYGIALRKALVRQDERPIEYRKALMICKEAPIERREWHIESGTALSTQRISHVRRRASHLSGLRHDPSLPMRFVSCEEGDRLRSLPDVR